VSTYHVCVIHVISCCGHLGERNPSPCCLVAGCVGCAQAALLGAFGPELLPTFLGGRVDYEAVRQQWLDKMDAAIAQRQQHPCGKQVGWGCGRCEHS
jgi:hypothetical protein